MVIASIAFATLLASPIQDAIKHVTLHQRKAAYFIKALWPRIASPLGMEFTRKIALRIGDSDSDLVLQGPTEMLDKLIPLIAYFDVKPKQVLLECTTSNPHLGLSVKSTAVIENNGTWNSTFQPLEATEAISPRINDDGTITLDVSLRDPTVSGTTVYRSKNGASYTFVPESGGSVNLTRARPDSKGVQIMVKATIVED